MLAGYSDLLRQRVEPTDATARVMIHGRANGAADLRQQYDHFVAADGTHLLGLDALPATCETLTDPAGVRLKATNGSGPASTIVTSYAHDEAFGGGGPFLDPLTKDAKDRFAALVMWGGTASSNLELNSVQVRLHPRYDTTLRKDVRQTQGWRLDLFAVSTLFHQTAGGTGIVWKLVPICTAYADAPGEAEGWVLFSFGNNRPRPKSYWPDGTASSVPIGFPFVQCPWTVAMVQGINQAGGPASNIAWAFDGGHGVVGTLDTLRGLKIRWEDLSQLAGGVQNLPFPNLLAGPGAVSIREYGNRVPAIQFGYAQYTTPATVVYSGAGNKLNLGSVPASPPELALAGEVPVGCALTGQVSTDNVNFYAFTDGQTVDTVGPGLATQQTYYVKATLTPNATQDATPILRAIGAVVVATTDFSDVAEIESVHYALDPVTLKPEIPELTFHALHDGERDFRDAITTFLSQNALGGLSVRLYIGDAKLARNQWLYKDEFLVENPDFQGPHARLTAIHPLSRLRQALPILTSEVAGIPNADTSNPGAWTKSAGTVLCTQIADAGGAADDSTYIASPNNPSGAACTLALSGIGTPLLPGGVAQLVGVEVQVRAAMAAGVGPVNLTVELLEGVTSRASQVFAITTTTVTFLQLKLTPAQITSIGNWSNLSVRFTASGTGIVWVTWARLAQLAMRPPLSYANASIATVATDLLANQAALDARWRGATIVDPSPALTVSKTIQAQAGGSTDLGMAKAELDSLARLLGGAFLPEQGKVRYRPFFDLVTAAANGVGFVPRVDQIVARFPAEEVAEPITVSPNYQQRVPEYDVPWGYNPADGSWQGEARAFFGPAFTSFRDATVDADPRMDSGTAQWVADAALAGAVAQRQVQCFGLGLLVWRFRSIVRHPEISLGDLISLDTDRFAAYDPVGLRALAGPMSALGFVVGIYDVWGTDLAIWIPTWANLVPTTRATPASQPPPTPQAVQILSRTPVWRGNHLYVNWEGSSVVGSVKVATSTTAYPAAGTGTATDGPSGLADCGTFVYGNTIYLTVTPYGGPAGTGLQGTASYLRIQLAYADGMFDPGTGKPLRTQVYPDGSYALRATENDGSTKKSDALNLQGSLLPFVSPISFFSYADGGPATNQMWVSVGWSAGVFSLPDQSTPAIAGPPAAPAAPTLGQVAGGALAGRTRFVRVAYVKVDGGFTNLYPVSAESSFAISINNLLKVTSPANPGGSFYDGWAVLVGATTGTEFVQGVVHGEVIALGTDWTEPVGGYSTTQNSAWAATWKSLTRVGLAASATYYHYPYYDLTNGIVRMLSNVTARSPSMAATQNGDGNMSLGAYDVSAGYSGAFSIVLPAGGGTGSGTFGGGRLQ